MCRDIYHETVEDMGANWARWSEKALFERQVCSVISLGNGFQHMTVYIQALFFYHNVICCHVIFFTYFLPQRSPRVDSVIIVSSINWLRMSFSTSAHRAFIDLVLDYLCSLGLERRLGETKSIPSKWSWIGEQAGRCETSVTWAQTFRHAFSPVDRYYDWRSHTHTQSTPKSATSAELFSQQGSMNDWNHFDFVQPL